MRAQCGLARRSAAQRSAAQHSAARRGAAQRVRKVRWWLEKELRGLGLNANRAGALWAEGPELKGPGEGPRDIASALCYTLA